MNYLLDTNAVIALLKNQPAGMRTRLRRKGQPRRGDLAQARPTAWVKGEFHFHRQALKGRDN